MQPVIIWCNQHTPDMADQTKSMFSRLLIPMEQHSFMSTCKQYRREHRALPRPVVILTLYAVLPARSYYKSATREKTDVLQKSALLRPATRTSRAQTRCNAVLPSSESNQSRIKLRSVSFRARQAVTDHLTRLRSVRRPSRIDRSIVCVTTCSS